MTEAWISQQIAPYFSLLSLTAIVAYLEPFAQRGERRALVMFAYRALAVFGFALAALAIAAFALQQPWYVRFVFTLCAGVILPVSVSALNRVGKLYSAAELRKSVSDDL